MKRVSRTTFLVVAVAVVVALAFFVSPFASDAPDGLEKVAADNGLRGDDTTRASVSDDVSTGVAGLIGIAVTFTIAGGLFVVVRRVRRPVEPTAT